MSFSFRGNDTVREAMNSAFLYHAIQAGLDMAIINPSQLMVYQDIPADLLEKVEDVLLDRRPDASDRLIEFADQFKGADRKVVSAEQMEISRLRAELARVKMERDILGKATAYFARAQS